MMEDLERKKVPEKLLRHFPLVPRFERLFASMKTAEEAQWHKLKRTSNDKEISILWMERHGKILTVACQILRMEIF